MIRWLIPIIGIIAISVLIWFGGPMVAINDAKPFASILNRILLILIIIILWALNFLWKQLKEKKANEQLMDGLAEGEAKPAQRKLEASSSTTKDDEDAAVIQKNFHEALSVLKKTKLKGRHGEQHLYELPWYIIIGPPGAGKTTALANSGLRFPLGDRFGQLALRGVGGTRNCDWWFTDDAVLLDTAGRYTTQDSDVSADSEGWNSFLGQLKKYRTRRPINGVFVAISLIELLQQNEAERAIHANAIKQRIHELNQKLGINTPIYVLFTKCDLIAGFMEFFDDLGREDRAQVWGFTFPLDSPSDPQGVVQNFLQEYDILLQRLNSRVMSRLHQERDPQRRSLIHAFPYQMGALKELADKFLKDIFKPSQFEDRFLLRGVYFTSGTQEGTPIDRMMGSLAATFGLNRQTVPSYSGQGKSYFLTHLFQDVIFKESNLVGTDTKFERQRQWVQRGAYAAAVVITISSVFAWTASYNGNSNYIKAAEEKINLFKENSKKLNKYSNVSNALPALTALKQAADIYKDETIPGYTGLGLKQEGTIHKAGELAYQAALNSIFVPLARARLEQQLSTVNDNPDFVLSALKVYLMLGDPNRREPELIKLWVKLDMQNTLTGDKEERDQLDDQLNYLTNYKFPAQPLDQTVIKLARASLNSIPTKELVYSRLKQEAQTDREPDFLLDNELGPSGQDIFITRKGQENIKQIPSLYTYKGYHDFYLKNGLRLAKESTEENWVMGEQPKHSTVTDPKELEESVRKRYLDDYIKYWNSLLNGLSIVKFTSLNQGVEVLETLSAPNSPLRNLLLKVDENTRLDRAPNGIAAIGAVIDSKTKESQRIAQTVKRAASQDGQSETSAAIVSNEFSPLTKLVESEKGAPTELDNILKTLSSVHAYLAGIAGTPDGSAAFQAAAKKMSGQPDAISNLKTQAIRLQSPMKDWLNDIADNSWKIILSNARKYINNVWRADVYDIYSRSLAERYPLYARSTKDSTLSDFARFFSPKGTINNFFAKYMSPFITTGRRHWQLRVVDNHTIGIDKSDVRMFQQASLIKDTFFSNGGEKPLIEFSMKPIDMDAAIYKFTLDLDEQRVSYRHGPSRSTKLQWPGPTGASRTRITFETTANNLLHRTFDGDWGWFRALDLARMKPTKQRDKLRVTFSLSNLKVQYELHAASVNNPYTLTALKQFRCPKNL